MLLGNTVIDHSTGGARSPSRVRLSGRTLAARAPHPLYWLLVFEKDRTYRSSHSGCREYWPRRRPTPRDAQRLVDEVADAQFGEHYRAAEGVVRFAASRGRVKPLLGPDRPPLAVRPEEVSFFLARNPRYLAGEELVCLAPFRADNLRRAVRDGFEGWRRLAASRR